jgi:hypothetical protein
MPWHFPPTRCKSAAQRCDARRLAICCQRRVVGRAGRFIRPPARKLFGPLPEYAEGSGDAIE